MKIIVAGVEGNGNHWATDTLPLHPDAEVLGSGSFPCQGPEPGTGYYPKLADLDPTGTATVVVMCRDRRYAQASRLRRGFDKVHPDQMDYDEAVLELARELENWPAPIVFISYETLVTWRERYFRQVLRQIGLDPDRFPTQLVIHDGNAKYFGFAHAGR